MKKYNKFIKNWKAYPQRTYNLNFKGDSKNYKQPKFNDYDSFEIKDLTNYFGYFQQEKLYNVYKEYFKVGLLPSKKRVFTYFNKNPLTMIKSAFYFRLKTLFIFDISTFLS